MKVVSYPKTECPFVREQVNKKQYLATPEIKPGFEWIFDDDVRAVDKLDGSNHCSLFKDGSLIGIDNRSNRLIWNGRLSLAWNRAQAKAMTGVCNALAKGWLDNCPENSRIYGELVGPKINGNRHKLEETYFVPFDWASKNLAWEEWYDGTWEKSFQGLRDALKELPSKFSQIYAKKTVVAEGLILVSPCGRVAKVRRDMFDYNNGA